MAMARKDPNMSVEEFFKVRESDPDHRYEYIDGEIHMMSGGSARHARVILNLGYMLEKSLRGGSCIAYSADACFQVTEDCYACPDTTVTCDPRDRDENSEEEDGLKIIQYPRFVAEILSPGTTARDRGVKAALYQEHPTLQEFLLIETKAPKLQLYRRESNNRWTIYLLTLEDEIELTSLGVRFQIAELYEGTRFVRRSE